MRNRANGMRSGWRNLAAAAAIAALSVPSVLGVLTAPVSAQSPASQSPATPVLATPAAQSLEALEAAGIKMAFEVASVKPNKSNDPAKSTFPMGPGDAYVPTGGLFSATNQPLIAYLRFAYKLGQSDLPGLSAWVYNDRFDIEARTQGNPTKDQVRLMMQALLVDRFKLAAHTGTKQGPVYALVLSKPGKTGPQLQPDADPCSTAPRPRTPGLQLPPIPCGTIGPFPTSAPGRGRLVGRTVTLGRIAGFLKNPYTGLDRPVLDHSGLTGTFDFSLEWSLAPDTAQPPGSQPEDTGPTFLEALKEQLGLKLEPQKGPVDVLVIDHVEQPSEN